MKLFSGLFIIIAFVVGLAVESQAFRLREIHSIPLEGNSKVYGIASGNIVIESDNVLSFLNRRWNVHKEITLDSNQTAIIAENGLYYAIVEKSVSNSSDSSFSNIVTIYNHRHIAQWGNCEIIDGDYYLAATGDYFLTISKETDSFSYRLYLCHKKRPVIEIHLDGFSWIKFSDDGKYFLVDCGKWELKLFNESGEIVNEFEHQRISSFGQNSDWIAHFVSGYLMTYHKNDKILELDIKKSLLYELILQNDIDRIILLFKKELKVLDLNNGSVLWEARTNKEGGAFISADISPSGKYIACGVDINRGTYYEKGDRHVTGYLYLYDIEGKTINEHRFNYSSYTLGIPRVRFLPDNRTISVETKEKLHFIEMR